MSLQDVEKWVADNVEVQSWREEGTLHCEVTCNRLPLDAMKFWQLVCHPENFLIFRNIQRCTYRKVLWTGPNHHQVVEVENESDWQLFFIRGALKTRMLVEENLNRGMMHFTLAPNNQSPLQDLYGRWEIRAISPDVPSPCHDSKHSQYCSVKLYQRFTPKNLPPFLFPAFARFTVRQLRNTFEDLMAEVKNITDGTPTLVPYTSVFDKETVSEDGDEDSSQVDANSVLAALEEASSASSKSRSRNGSCSTSSKASSAASMAASSKSEPSSHALDLLELAAEDEDLARQLQSLAVGQKAASKMSRLSSVYVSLKALSASKMKAAKQWIDDHVPLDEEAFENAWASAFGDDIPRSLWLVW